MRDGMGEEEDRGSLRRSCLITGVSYYKIES